jgi:hypothetical protein
MVESGIDWRAALEQSMFECKAMVEIWIPDLMAG